MTSFPLFALLYLGSISACGRCFNYSDFTDPYFLATPFGELWAYIETLVSVVDDFYKAILWTWLNKLQDKTRIIADNQDVSEEDSHYTPSLTALLFRFRTSTEVFLMSNCSKNTPRKPST